MLELIFQGFMEWAYGLVLECWQYFSSALLDIMSLDFAYLKTHAPVVTDIMQVLLAAGWALLLGNLVFQAIKSMASGLGFEGEDPKILFARTFVFAFLLLASPQICELVLSVTSKVMTVLQLPDAVSVTLVDESVFGSLTAAWLLVIICGLIIMFKVLRLLLEIAERYVILAMLTITAPLAFAMGGSRSTSEIFTGWCRMFGSMCVVMATNVIFFKLLLSVLSTIPSGLDVLPWMVLIMTIAKVARKADAIVTRIGLNPAITGDSLGVRFPGALTYMVIRSVTSQVAKTAGRSAGSSGRGAAPNKPPGGSGGGPRGGGPVGGSSQGMGFFFGRTGGGAHGGEVFAGRSGGGGSVAGSTQQTERTVHGVRGGQEAAQEKEADSGAFARACPAGAVGEHSRKSAVPPGARRSPGHVKSAASSAGGIFGAAAGRSAAQPAARQEHTSHTRDVTGTAAMSQHGAAGTPPHVGDIKRPGTSQPRTAGMGPGTASRFTQAAAQTVQGGDISAQVQAAEQNNISVGQPPHTSGGPYSKQGVPGQGVPRTPGGASARGAGLGPGPSRFTRREVSGQKAASPTPATPSPAGTIAAGAGYIPGQPTGRPRHSRKGPSDIAPAPVQATGSSPARQETPKAVGTAIPSTVGGAGRAHPGSAGTAAAGHQASETRQAARRATTRARSAPAATDSLGGKRMSSSASPLQKGRITAVGGSSPPKPETRPPKGKRGPAHGK